MTEQETLKWGESLYENITSNANNIIPTKEYIEFVRMANKALEKQIPKKPAIDHNKGSFIRKKCVVCGNIVMPFDGKYCAECGQRLE